MVTQENQDKSLALRELAQKFVWMLRKDVRKGVSLQKPPSAEFQKWWLLRGRAEYPAWGVLEEKDRQYFAQLSTPFKLGSLNMKFPRALELIAKSRPDVIERFTVKGKLDSVAMAGWFFMLGLQEYCLESIVDSQLIQILDQPYFGESADEEAVTESGEIVPHVTVLMRLVWQLLDPQLQKPMALDQPETRQRFIVWFFCAATKLYPLSALISNRWRQWLLQNRYIEFDSAAKAPRFALFEYRLKKELNEHLDLTQAVGLQGLMEWANTEMAPTGSWSWLVQDGKQDAKPLPKMPKSKSRPFGVNLYGFAYGELGIGEDLRMAVAACEAAQIPYRIVNINAGKDLRQADHELRSRVESSESLAPYAVNIFCLPAFDTVSRIFLRLGQEVFENHYNIGWWPWELEVWPKAWKGVFHLVDEVWAGSSFSHAMYQKSSLKPCYLMPLAVSVDRVKPFTRRHFKLPGKPYLFLYVFDFNSHLNRKNPMALIHAFQEAFPAQDRSVGLVLKIMNTNSEDVEWLKFKALCKADSRIYLIDKTMDRPEVLGLIQACDAYVSPHRAEGFGRTLAEAMLFGKPVIATNYSGNTSFMDPNLSFPVGYELVSLQDGDYHFIGEQDHASWAQPSGVDLAEKMKLGLEASKRDHFAADLKKYASAQFSVDRTAQLLKDRLAQIQRQMNATLN